MSRTSTPLEHARPLRRGAPQQRPTVFRPEIEGLRTVAFLLVAVFHIWFDRVSGGVDVFFTVAGFLIAVTLLSHIRRFGTIRPGLFFGRLAMRLLPAAALVLVAVLVAGLLLFPVERWYGLFVQVLASATYWENWFLGVNAVDYLATDTSRSPVQHFWALSIQGQMYVLWFLIIGVVAWIVRRNRGSARRVAIPIVSVMIVASFAWSVFQTETNQQFAYFSTFTRVWEFGLGVLLALVLDHIRIPRVLAAISSWVGLVAILSIGALLPVADMFPGYVALIPVAAACLIVASGQQEASWGASSVLASKPLVWFGSLGYGVYLWHWPVLIFALEITGLSRADILTGVVVLVLSVALAFATRKLVEEPLLGLRASSAPEKRRRGLVTAIVSMGAVLASSLVGFGAIQYQMHAERQALLERVADPCFGATALADPSCGITGDVTPSWPEEDVSNAQYERACRTPPAEPVLSHCRHGDPRGETRVALLGNSHAMSWFSAVDAIASDAGWRLDVYYQPGCTVNANTRMGVREETRDNCDAWVEKVLGQLPEAQAYDYVFVSASATQRRFIDPVSGEETFEAGVDGYHELWEPLIARGSTIVALRDYPHQTTETLGCAFEDPRDASCGRSAEESVVEPGREVLAVAANALSGVELIETSEWFCADGFCPAVIGDAQAFTDPTHLTATYSLSLSDPLREALAERGILRG